MKDLVRVRRQSDEGKVQYFCADCDCEKEDVHDWEDDHHNEEPEE